MEKMGDYNEVEGEGSGSGSDEDIIYLDHDIQSSFNIFNTGNIQSRMRYLKDVMSTLLHKNSTIRFLEYYIDSTTTETIKVDDITAIIHRQNKFFQGMDPQRKGGHSGARKG